jgi:uncharacterized protein
MAAMTEARYAPTQVRERIDALDSTRGFALFGILLINIVAFSTPGTLPFLTSGEQPADRILLAAILVLVESKFFTLFSLLFGMGFALQWLKAEQKGTPFVPFFRRRLFFLGVFGVLHILLLWEGDILLLYALVGLLLIPFRNAQPRTLRRWIIGLIAIPTILYALLLAGLLTARAVPDLGREIAQADAEIVTTFVQEAQTSATAYDTGSYGEILVKRLESVPTTAIVLITRVPTVLAMFMIGLYCGKTGILTSLGDHAPLLRRVRRIGLGVGLIVALLVGAASLLAPPTVAFVAAFFNQALAGPFTALGYGAAFVLATLYRPELPFVAPLAAYGRMALTNYLLHSVICTTLFYGYGFALIGDVSRLGALGIVLVIHLVLIAFSMLWLRRFRYGPMEWLWRSLNYGRVQPLR